MIINKHPASEVKCCCGAPACKLQLTIEPNTAGRFYVAVTGAETSHRTTLTVAGLKELRNDIDHLLKATAPSLSWGEFTPKHY